MIITRQGQAIRAYGGCLGARADEGRGKLRKASGEPQAGIDPEISEWGNPARVIPCDPILNT